MPAAGKEELKDGNENFDIHRSGGSPVFMHAKGVRGKRSGCALPESRASEDGAGGGFVSSVLFPLSWRKGNRNG